MEYKRNVITLTFTHLCTLQKLEDLYIGTFVKEPGDDFPRQLNFKAKIARFQPYFPHLILKPSFIFEAELGTGTCLQSSAICHSFPFSCFKEMNNFKFFTRAKFHKTKSAPDGQNGTENSTCQLKSPFDRFSRCHTNLLEYHSQQNKQLGTVMSNDNLFYSSGAQS